MKVRALVAFAGTDAAGGSWYSQKGQEFELPAGVDWLKAGLVEAVEKPRKRTRKQTRKIKKS